MTDVVFDLETFGPPPDGVLVAIGATTSEDSEFYRNVDARKQRSKYGRKIDTGTIYFWAGAEAAQGRRLRDPVPVPFEKAIGRPEVPNPQKHDALADARVEMQELQICRKRIKETSS